ncbi:hypothetical protein [Streptomyces sp. HSG2]|uniref:hypothetical protein n=1 Tax=Streptomyces sp. HSG2 TaxID=2797167 RepID=UPI001908D9A9|nr:hypothetical protein [Streptomyces sp. HSG2]
MDKIGLKSVDGTRVELREDDRGIRGTGSKPVTATPAGLAVGVCVLVTVGALVATVAVNG